METEFDLPPPPPLPLSGLGLIIEFKTSFRVTNVEIEWPTLPPFYCYQVSILSYYYYYYHSYIQAALDSSSIEGEGPFNISTRLLLLLQCSITGRSHRKKTTQQQQL